MKANRTRKPLSLFAVLFTVVAVSFGGCAVLQNTPLGQLFNFDLLGTTPAENGMVGFNVLGAAGSQSFNGLEAEGAKVVVRDESAEGFSVCEYKGQERAEGSKFNSLSLLLDDSGSMGMTGADVTAICPTCPHDPAKLRVQAAKALIESILTAGPESTIGVMRFGPAVSSGYTATEVLADFSNDPIPLVNALELLNGEVSAGTPLWDSLYEVLGATEEEAKELEIHLQTVVNPGQAVDVKRYIVVLSDGADTDSTIANLELVIQRAKEHGIAVYAIGLGPASITNNSPLLQVEEQIETVQALQSLAIETGGLYASVNDPAALQTLYEAVAVAMTEGYFVETYECLPNGEEPKPGQLMEGFIITAECETDYSLCQTWTMLMPEEVVEPTPDPEPEPLP